MASTNHYRQVILRLLAPVLLFSLIWAGSQEFPRAAVKNLTGQRVELHDTIKGKLTLVNFWATYCVPCRKEMKILNQLNAQYAPRGFQVVGVAIDNSKTVGRVSGLVRSQKLDYQVLLDTDQNLYRTFNTNAMPFSVLVNSEGEIIWEHTGYIPGDEVELEKILKTYLAPDSTHAD